MFFKPDNLEKAKKALKEKILELKSREVFIRTEGITDESTKPNGDMRSASKGLHYEEIKSTIQERIKKEKELPRSVALEPGFEKLSQLPTKVSRRQERKLKQQERSKTKGKMWFGMKAPEMTEEKLNDLKIIQMRNVLDPTRFYKNTDIRPGVLPKFFQTGTVVENAADFYSGRVPMKKRKKTLVDELLEDAEFKKYQKRKHKEVFAKTMSGPIRKKKKVNK